MGQSPMSAQTVFVMMPFRSEFDDVYATVQNAVAAVDGSMSVVRLDEIRAAGSISQDLVEEITRATVCLADVTEANPNVMWEVGFATALRKPVIAISQVTDKLPFDIKDIRTVTYERGSLSKTLRDPLTEVIKATLERFVNRRRGLREEQQQPSLRTIAITGSMNVPQAGVIERLRRLLNPYIGAGYHWYVGSFGDADEAILSYLLGVGEASITVVGHSSYDISERQLRALEEHPDVAFIDVDREQIPRVQGASSKRDVLLVSRSDLLVLIWDGQSNGTRSLIDWLTATNKDHIVGFVSPS